uniref:Uncharacterized protein n=1 Tax=Arundo donax TaxID=35708 RepID=A0A0A8XNU2_ARUDO
MYRRKIIYKDSRFKKKREHQDSMDCINPILKQNFLDAVCINNS